MPSAGDGYGAITEDKGLVNMLRKGDDSKRMASKAEQYEPSWYADGGDDAVRKANRDTLTKQISWGPESDSARYTNNAVSRIMGG